MKFVVSNSALSSQLQIIGGVVGSNSIIPILENFLFEVSKGELSVTACDMETTMTSKLEIKSEQQGKVAIPAKMLQEILKSLAEQPLTFIVDQDTNSVRISAESGTYSLACFPADEYPKVEEIIDTKTLNMPAYLIAKGIEKTIYATGTDELKPVLSGIFFKFDEQGITMVATDSHKLVKYHRDDVNCGIQTEFIIPKKPLGILKSVFANVEQDIQIQYNETNVKITLDKFEVMCRLINGSYPNYEAVIPKENPNVLTISKVSFLNAVRRVSIFSSKITNQIKFEIKGSEFKLSAQDVDFSHNANESLPCNYKGDEIKIGFNSKYLVEVLSNLASEEVLLEMSAPNRAGVLTPVDGLEDGENILALVMPVAINN